MRRPILALAAITLLASGIARAAVEAEPIPADVIQQIMPLASQVIAAQFPNPPVKVEPLLEKTTGWHVQEEFGCVVMPDKNLAPAVVNAAGDKSVPAGVLVTRKLSLEVDGKLQGEDKIAVADLNGVAKLPIFFLAVKGKGEERSLEVYSRDGTPVATAPLRKQDLDATEQLSVRLKNIDLEKKRLDLQVRVAGTLEATLKLGVLEL